MCCIFPFELQAFRPAIAFVPIWQPMGPITHTCTNARTFSQYSHLRMLDLSGNMLVSDAAIIKMAHGCPRLSTLNCMMMPALSGCLSLSNLFPHI